MGVALAVACGETSATPTPEKAAALQPTPTATQTVVPTATPTALPTAVPTAMATSPKQVKNGDTLEEGFWIQVEAAGIDRNTPFVEARKQFADALTVELADRVREIEALGIDPWMTFPVCTQVILTGHTLPKLKSALSAKDAAVHAEIVVEGLTTIRADIELVEPLAEPGLSPEVSRARCLGFNDYIHDLAPGQ